MTKSSPGPQAPVDSMPVFKMAVYPLVLPVALIHVESLGKTSTMPVGMSLLPKLNLLNLVYCLPSPSTSRVEQRRLERKTLSTPVM